MHRHFFIHGHFYQPPREDPWLGDILPEGSAAPEVNWNQRILKESYAPMAWARRSDDQGRVFEIINCYEWMSFNFGPTLLCWLERADPQTYQRVLDADKASIQRLGKGNAMAQIYHHVILPLASDLDKRLETAWAVEDFAARFGRQPEGMWLAESAVDIPSLEVLADYGVKFTILAPRQARAVAQGPGQEYVPVQEHELDIMHPYSVELPSGRDMAVFFYQGGLSQAVAFERLLEDGERFFTRMSQAHPGHGVLSLGTDGETYGHHFPFGEMALAHVISQAREGRDGMFITNPAAWLQANPPTRLVQLWEPSSWSCVHGVERWRNDCGCTTGDTPNANQAWRTPLRNGLNDMKAAIDAHFFDQGAKLFKDAEQALLEYGRILAGAVSRKEYDTLHFAPRLSAQNKRNAWRLLEMQQWALSSFASCAWFFDEISRIEPINCMTFALRAMELCRQTDGPDLETAFTDTLAQARSNYQEKGTGKDLFRAEVVPRRESLPGVVAQAVLHLSAEGRLDAKGGEVVWPSVSVEAKTSSSQQRQGELVGKAALLPGDRSLAVEFSWRWEPDAKDMFTAPVRVTRGKGKEAEETIVQPSAFSWNRRQAIALKYAAWANEQAWDCMMDSMQLGPSFFLERQIAQRTQQWDSSWGLAWPGLAWAWITGSPCGDEAFLLEFLQSPRRGWAGEEAVCARLVDALLEMLRQSSPAWSAAREMVRKSMSLNLHPDWTPVQNLLWERWRKEPAAHDLALFCRMVLG